MRAALSNAGLAPGGIDRVMLASLNENELEAVREVFDRGEGPPVIMATAGVVGETFAAGPALNAAIALSTTHTGRVLVNGISCEGGCGSMIVKGATTR